MRADRYNFARGALSASGTNGAGVLDTVSTASRSQNWSLDALGNWSSLTTDGTTHTRSHNSQNQITAIQTETTPTYDHNGNTTKDNAGQQYTYDAWNHIHLVKDAGNTTLVTYSYDAVCAAGSRAFGGVGLHAGFEDGGGRAARGRLGVRPMRLV